MTKIRNHRAVDLKLVSSMCLAAFAVNDICQAACILQFQGSAQSDLLVKKSLSDHQLTKPRCFNPVKDVRRCMDIADVPSEFEARYPVTLHEVPLNLGRTLNFAHSVVA